MLAPNASTNLHGVVKCTITISIIASRKTAISDDHDITVQGIVHNWIEGKQRHFEMRIRQSNSRDMDWVVHSVCVTNNTKTPSILTPYFRTLRPTHAHSHKSLRDRGEEIDSKSSPASSEYIAFPKR